MPGIFKGLGRRAWWGYGAVADADYDDDNDNDNDNDDDGDDQLRPVKICVVFL